MGGMGVIVRDDKGTFVAALAKKAAGISSPIVVEAIAAREAALFVLNVHAVKMILEGDALLVLSALQNTGESCNSPHGHLFIDTRKLMQGIQHWSFKHTRREANKVVHRLARFSLSIDDCITWFQEPPDVIADLLIEDSTI